MATVERKQLLSATISPAGTKIVIRGTKPENAEFMHGLPTARWHKGECCWTCDATPAAAERIVGVDFAAIEADEAVRALATDFQIGRRRAIAATLRSDLPQPELRKLDGWQHQLRAYHFANELPAAELACAMGTGKSKVAVDLIQNNRDKTILIASPVSVLGVWRREFARHGESWEHQIHISDTRWTVKRRAKEAAEFLDRQRRTDRPAAVVVNYESIWRSEFGDWALSQLWDRVVADEVHRIKAHNSECSKFAAKLYGRSGRRLGLTGTPMTNGPLDIYGQYRFLDPGIFGTSWHRFSNEFAVMSEMYPGQVVRYKNQEEFARRFGLIAYRVESDVLNLPPAVHSVIPVQLGAKAQRVYRDLEREMITEIGDGFVTVANALVKLIRLAQATSGFTQLDESKEIIELGDEKAIALRDLLSDFDRAEPVVVFCRFRHDLDRVSEVAAQLNLRYGELSGRRHDLTDHATMPDWVDVMGVQYQSGGVGIDLTRSRYWVAYSPTYSLADYDQSIARLNRPGQTRTVFCYHLAAVGTVDERIAQAVEQKREIIEAVLELMRGEN